MYSKEKTVRNVRGKAGYKWSLPTVLCFAKYASGDFVGATKMFFYTVTEWRCPKAGEWFISGALPTAYYAPNDLSMEYLIAVPTKRAKSVTAWVEVEDVD